MTVILNNMRLMVVIDWWMEFHTFLSQAIPPPEDTIQESSEAKYEPIAGILMLSRGSSASALIQPSELLSPVSVSAGIVTKRAPILDVPLTTFELKINISKCELVVIEDPAVWDTNAIILKVCFALNFRMI